MLAQISFRSPFRSRVAVELVLGVLLVAQIPVWFFVLNAPAMAPSGQAGLVISVPTAATVDGPDPFFAGSAQEFGAVPAHTLYAVRTGDRPGAILAGPDGVQKAVAVGETVSEGVTLAAVGADHVILAHGRARSRLDFPPPPAASFAPQTPVSIRTPGAAAAAPPAGAEEAASYETALRPVESGGTTEGYVWRAGTDGGILAAVGLRPGDVLLRINGTPFDRHERLGELAADIAAGRPVELEYRRNGSNYSATYSPE